MLEYGSLFVDLACSPYLRRGAFRQPLQLRERVGRDYLEQLDAILQHAANHANLPIDRPRRD